ncbi:MAG TPA: aquaporin [Gemmatimonadales bacterium]|nr:aquaporin [Gemmatimonadales bacterium]
MPFLFRRCLAEALGTFALVFIGAGSVMSTTFPNSGYGMLGIAIAHGLVLAVMVSSTMAISGGHLNPAVTIGLLVTRRGNPTSAAAYIAAQLIGAILAALLLKVLYPAGVGKALALGTPTIASSISLTQAIGLELVFTFFLVSAVFGTCVHPDAPKVGGFGIGLVLVFDIIMGGPLTGAAMNPARAFGPALVSGQWVGQIAYWIGPLLGGILAGLVWEYLLLPRASERRTAD